MQSTVYQIPEVGLAEYGLAEYGLAEYGLADSCTAEYGLAEYGLARYSPPSAQRRANAQFRRHFSIKIKRNATALGIQAACLTLIG